MAVPHSLTLLEMEDLICVADRGIDSNRVAFLSHNYLILKPLENRRILCYTAGLSGERRAGRLVFNIKHKNLGKVYAIDHIGMVYSIQ